MKRVNKLEVEKILKSEGFDLTECKWEDSKTTDYNKWCGGTTTYSQYRIIHNQFKLVIEKTTGYEPYITIEYYKSCNGNAINNICSKLKTLGYPETRTHLIKNTNIIDEIAERLYDNENVDDTFLNELWALVNEKINKEE